ncbi:MAG: hypothetical protein U9N87_04525 [Planctomycetota bacterium]|nr:hypothetical protein [Planctomycetota bacterium]
MIRTKSHGSVLVLLLFLAPWLFVAVGCGPSRPEVAKVKGKITFRGAPVTTGQIVFLPEKGRPARGKIGADGTYSLTTFDADDGAVLGKHTVTIESIKVHESGPRPKSMEEEIKMAREAAPGSMAGGAVQHLIPPKYSNRETSGLSKEVVRGENTFDFEL